MSPYEPDDRPRARRPITDAPEPEPEAALAVVAPRRRRRLRPAVETVLLASTAALLAAVAWPIATAGLRAPDASAPAAPAADDPAPLAPAEAPTIQIALLLDTSSSMDGLIDQARTQLWRVVNALDSATFHGATPKLELALYEYGNDRLDPEAGFIRQVSPFTVELDRVSEALFSLSTMGGSEHTGQVIARSIDELAWSDGEGTLRVVYIAGNESFDQGPVAWRDAIERARAKGIVVNTVVCNDAPAGWEDAAMLAGGRFMKIDHDAIAQYIAAPQDAEIARLGTELNGTYVGYGGEGRWGVDNQMAQDRNGEGSGMETAVQRALSKGSIHYRNPTWDLVDAVADGTVSLDDVDRATLPEDAKNLDDGDLAAWVDGKRADRETIAKRLRELSVEREAFVAQERVRHLGEDPARLDTAIVASILDQAKAAGFTIGDAA